MGFHSSECICCSSCIDWFCLLSHQLPVFYRVQLPLSFHHKYIVGYRFLLYCNFKIYNIRRSFYNHISTEILPMILGFFTFGCCSYSVWPNYSMYHRIWTTTGPHIPTTSVTKYFTNNFVIIC